MSGSIAGDRIPHSAVNDTIDWYRDILKRYPKFRSLVPTGSTTDATRKDHGDIDIATYLEGTDIKQVKKDFMSFLNSLPDNITVPFRDGRHRGDKVMMYADIVTCQVPIAGFEGLLVQVDNAIVLSEIEQGYKKSFLDLPGEKQALLMGLARTVLQEENPGQVFKRLGIKKLPELGPNQEFEFVLSPTGLTLRKVTLENFKEQSREDVWKSHDWSDVKALFSSYDLDRSFDELLSDISKKNLSARSRRRINGIVSSTLTIGPGEEGKPKGDNKVRAKNAVSQMLGEVEVGEETKSVALYGGGFKPPHKAHFANAEKMCQKADRLIVFIGNKLREGVPITQEQSEKVWKIYAKYLTKPVEIRTVSSPISAIYDLIGNEELKGIEFYVAKSQGADEDKKFAYLLKNRDRYPNVKLITLPTISDKQDTKFSASTLRKSVEILRKGDWMPSCLDRDDAAKVLDILIKPLEYQALQEEIKAKMSKVLVETVGKLVENSSGTPAAPTSVISASDKAKLEKLYWTLADSLDPNRFFIKFNQSFILIKSTTGSSADLSDLYQELSIKYAGQATFKLDRDYIHIKPYLRPEWAQYNITGGYSTDDGTLYESHETDGDVLDKEYWIKNMASMIGFLKKKGLKLDPLPDIVLNKQEQGNGLLDRTGTYDPSNNMLEVFIVGRHPRDVMRTVMHELYHCHQNNCGKIKNITTEKVTEDPNLRDLEGECFREGNLLYREWLESLGDYN